MIIYSLPEDLSITGRVVSIEVAPPLVIGAKCPKYFTSKGALKRVNTSLRTFAKRAIVAIFAPENCPIKILDKL